MDDDRNKVRALEMGLFAEIAGNDPIKRYLTSLVEKNRIGHLLLFEGPEGIGKSLFADAFTKAILCRTDPQGKHRYKLEAGTHPDLHIYRPEGKLGMHSISAMRALSEEVYLPPFEAQRKIFIIHDADRMLPYSANALLKTFEEPSPETIIILLSSEPDRLLPTILSRCSAFRFHFLKEEEMVQLLIAKKGLTPEKAGQVARSAQGSVKKAFKLCEGADDLLRKTVLEMLIAGKFESYPASVNKAKELAGIIEESIKQIESSHKEEYLKGFCDKLSATQRENLEKEVEGIAAIFQAREADTLFDLLLDWHRDLHLLRAGGDPKFVLNSDVVDELQRINARCEELVPLERLLDAVKMTKLSLARSTSLHLCLENLFLRLGMV